MIWLSVKEVSQLINKSERTVERTATTEYQYRYVNGLGRGGRAIQIALESLPQDAQDKYHNVEREPESILHFSGKQREAADAKAWVILQYEQSELSADEFIEWYNVEYPEDQITKRTLYRWKHKFEDGGIAALIDERGGYNKGMDTISQDAWDCFYSLYMTQQKRTIRLCYDITKSAFPIIPSVSAFERRLMTIPQYAILAYREGDKAFNDNLPSMKRSRISIESNDYWFSDHHKFDVFIKSKDGRRVIRPWLTVFFDARSNRVVSHIVREASPNATVVKQCFRQGIEKNGIPNHVYFDNGKDYRSKDFNKDYPFSLTSRIGFKVVYAKPYASADGFQEGLNVGLNVAKRFQKSEDS